ncbi:hypothetical protein [Streptomyces sp. R44]|uniref:Uncharacterized protein n=1 Tax=Streptomyces sp. R44 TaxID=3238633 RepID=A0AB39SNI1_9ACTN
MTEQATGHPHESLPCDLVYRPLGLRETGFIGGYAGPWLLTAATRHAQAGLVAGWRFRARRSPRERGRLAGLRATEEKFVCVLLEHGCP